jgi:hypothetical protein
MFLRNTVKNFIELCLIVNSYKKWVLTALCAQTFKKLLVIRLLDNFCNLSDCFYKSICKANYIALPMAKVKSLI